MTPLRVSIFAAIAAILLLLVILELIRSRRLQERYALLWVMTALVLLVFALWRDGLNVLARTVGIAYPPSALFLLAAVFILVVLLHYSTAISELAERNLMLAQRIALLEQKLKEDGSPPELGLVIVGLPTLLESSDGPGSRADRGAAARAGAFAGWAARH